MSTATTIHALTLPTAQVLLEIFPRNAEKYAFLRVTLCNGVSKYEARFSNAELALQSFDLSSLERVPTAVEFENGELVIPHTCGVARLAVRDVIRTEEFVERVTRYLLFFQADVVREGDIVEGLKRKKEALVERVREGRDGKVGIDRNVRECLPVLLASKRGYVKEGLDND